MHTSVKCQSGGLRSSLLALLHSSMDTQRQKSICYLFLYCTSLTFPHPSLFTPIIFSLSHDSWLFCHGGLANRLLNPMMHRRELLHCLFDMSISVNKEEEEAAQSCLPCWSFFFSFLNAFLNSIHFKWPYLSVRNFICVKASVHIVHIYRNNIQHTTYHIQHPRLV